MSLFNPHLEGGPLYWDAGPTGVLLIHGFTATTAEVRLFAPRLREAGYSVAAPLLPGHGTNPKDANRQTWQEWACEAEEAYCQLQARCGRVFLAGESLGGLLAIWLGVRHPEVVGVMTYAPALRLTEPRKKRILIRLLAPFVTSIEKKPSTSTVWQGYPVVPLKAAYQLLKFQREVSRVLPSLRAPLLVIQGSLDPTVSAAVPEEVCRRAGSKVKEVHIMKKTAHCVLLDQELDEVTKISLEFMRRAMEAYEPAPKKPDT